MGAGSWLPFQRLKSVMPISIVLCIISSVMQKEIVVVWSVGIHGGIRRIRKSVGVLIAV
jgi:hypothetical protein